jgi:hypothetical protein
MDIEITIDVTPPVKKYIARKHNISPFVVSRENAFGLFLYNSLVKLKEQPRIAPLDRTVYSQQLRLGLSEDLYRRQGWYIHPKKEYDFNRLVEMMMDNDLQLFMDTRADTDIKIYQSFYDFREKFDLTEDEWALKMMSKRYERYRKKITN